MIVKHQYFLPIKLLPDEGLLFYLATTTNIPTN